MERCVTRGFDVLDPNLDLFRDYFLEASAGTGKTFTIENIVVRLLKEGVPLDQILIVTFTRAAAIELKMRIRESLQRAIDDAKIFTIHSFCFHTLKENALETGFPFYQNEESASLERRQQILKDFLRTELSPDEIHPRQLEKVLKRYQYDIERVVRELFRYKGEGRSFQTIKQEISREVERLGKIEFEELLELAPKFGQMCDRKRNVKPEIEEGLRGFSKIFAGEMDDLIDLPILKMIPENLSKKESSYPELLRPLNARLIPLLQEVSNTDAILNRLAHRAQIFLAQVKEKEELFFYDDLLTQLEKCIQRPSFAEKVRQQFRVVLIDEFQDTDPIQWNIFSTLFHGHIPLYLVGDPKQSIYRFRGADLYTYMEAKKSFGEEATATLTRNFRAEPSLVEALNFLFSRTSDLITLPKLAETIPIPPVEAALPPSKERGEIVFCDGEDESTLFSFIVQEIDRLHRMKSLPYRECAVLVADRYQARRFLTQCPLPAVTKRSESLLETDAFSILEDLFLALYNPRDRNAVMKVLGGSLFNFPLEQLTAGFEEQIVSFYRYHHLIKTEGILSFFRKTFPNADSDISQLVEIVAENTHSFEESLSFLQKLKRLDPESELLKKRASCDPDAIQVMTIHVSKGLEFETVFPVGLMRPAPLKDEEEHSEKMRQLYVALTRAKKRVYLPLSTHEKAPIHHFLSKALQGEFAKTFCDNHPNFSYAKCEKREISYSPPPAKGTSLPKSHHFSFPCLGIHSYSSLVEKHSFQTSSAAQKEGAMPAGPETGILLHQVFEKLPFDLRTRSFIEEELRGTHLEPWIEEVYQMVEETFHTPLPAPIAPFCLADVDPKKMIKEMEFLYPSDEPAGFIKGFVDLFFEYQDHFYFIDWKSNDLEAYTPQKIEEAMEMFHYELQAKLYKKALKKYLKLFNCENGFEGGFYFFLRGPGVKFL